jgi:hypothetical protein
VPHQGAIPLALVALVLITACGSRGAAASLAGTVEDSAGRPLAGAAVVVGDGSVRRADLTDASGTYRFDRLATGRVPVHVFAPGMIYDPGHGLHPLSPGANTFDVRLSAQQPGTGPSFVGDSTAKVSGTVVELSVQVEAGPGVPGGTELLALDAADGVAVLLRRSASGIASAEIPRAQVPAGVVWRFIATDNACQETPAFPSARTAE